MFFTRLDSQRGCIVVLTIHISSKFELIEVLAPELKVSTEIFQDLRTPDARETGVLISTWTK